jgi:hypothetical protein
MGFFNKLFKRNVEGIVAPNQYYNPTTDDYELIQGSNGAAQVTLAGRNAREPFSGTANITKIFSKSMNGFCISNDGSSDLTFTIDGDTYTVKSNEVFTEPFSPFTHVMITTTVPFRAYGLGGDKPLETIKSHYEEFEYFIPAYGTVKFTAPYQIIMISMDDNINGRSMYLVRTKYDNIYDHDTILFEQDEFGNIRFEEYERSISVYNDNADEARGIIRILSKQGSIQGGE